MNLIEQLGGYEKAKEILSRERNSENIDPVIYLNGNEILIDAICDALLEYRRQHNIYEVGDWVVYRNLPHERLFYVKAVLDGSIVLHECWDEVGAKCFSEFEPYSDIQHANDEEIKAGKRLEVS